MASAWVGPALKAVLCVLVVVLLATSFSASDGRARRATATTSEVAEDSTSAQRGSRMPCPARTEYTAPGYSPIGVANITLPSPTVAARAIAWALGDVASTRSVVVVASLGFGFTFAASRGRSSADEKLPRSVFDAAALEPRGSVTVLWNGGVNPSCKGGHSARMMAESFVGAEYGVRSVRWAISESAPCGQADGSAPSLLVKDPEVLIVGPRDERIHNSEKAVATVDAGVSETQREDEDPLLALRYVGEELSHNSIGVVVIMSQGRGRPPLVLITTDHEPRLTESIIFSARRGVSAYGRAGQMIALWQEDESCFCAHSQWNGRAVALMARYPARLRIATMNPCIVNTTTGAIGVGEIAIPPMDVYRTEEELHTLWKTGFTPMREKPAAVRWRGVTTGIPWRESQRFKALTRFAEILNATGAPESTFDVGASGIVQHVEPADIPLRRPGMSELDMGFAQVVLDLDGNANAWRGGHWKHFAGAAVLRVQGPYVLWYYRHLVNGTHVLWYDTVEEMADAAAALVRQPQSNETVALLERVAVGSQTFALAHLTAESLRDETEHSVRCAFHGGEDAQGVDWRMKRADWIQ